MYVRKYCFEEIRCSIAGQVVIIGLLDGFLNCLLMCEFDLFVLLYSHLHNSRHTALECLHKKFPSEISV